MNIQFDIPSEVDRDELYRFYLLTITDTFYKNGINDRKGITGEVEKLMKIFDNGNDVLMLARIEEKIIGTIAYGIINKSVSDTIPEDLLGLKEIKGVYIHPDFQFQGIGSDLWNKMITYLKNADIKKACLDSGYKIAQQYWKKKIGEPTYFMKDYWAEGSHQLIWVFQISDVLKEIIT